MLESLIFWLSRLAGFLPFSHPLFSFLPGFQKPELIRL
jgi:hypothetical protein